MHTNNFLELVLMILMPMAIYQLKDYAKEVHGNLTGPTKLFWLLLLCYIADVTGSILDVGRFGSTHIPFLLISILRMMYQIGYGVLVACFCKTFESRLRITTICMDGGSVFKQATEGLRDYQNLKKSCQLGLFMLFTCFTLRIITCTYMTIRNSNVSLVKLVIIDFKLNHPLKFLTLIIPQS